MFVFLATQHVGKAKTIIYSLVNVKEKNVTKPTTVLKLIALTEPIPIFKTLPHRFWADLKPHGGTQYPFIHSYVRDNKNKIKKIKLYSYS